MLSNYFRRTIWTIKGSPLRNIHTSKISLAAESSPLYKLRQRTGIAYNLCREALNKHNNDVDEAEAWLKAQALAHGYQRATKLRGRSTSEGLIGLAIHENNKLATMLELNCETDFVAKNQIFKDFTLDLVEQIATIQNGCDVKRIESSNCIEELLLTKNHLADIDKQIVPLITKLGENIRVQRALHFRTTEDQIQIFGQIHAQTGKKLTENLELMAGRFGSLVALRDLNATKGRSLRGPGQILCRHIIGFNPTYIELPENIRKHLETAEKLELEKQSADTEEKEEESCDPDDDEPVSRNSRDDWPSIMDQTLIVSDEQSVRDFCKESDISIVYFNRFECGN